MGPHVELHTGDLRRHWYTRIWRVFWSRDLSRFKLFECINPNREEEYPPFSGIIYKP